MRSGRSLSGLSDWAWFSYSPYLEYNTVSPVTEKNMAQMIPPIGTQWSWKSGEDTPAKGERINVTVIGWPKAVSETDIQTHAGEVLVQSEDGGRFHVPIVELEPRQ
jgi:hypothetical protein